MKKGRFTFVVIAVVVALVLLASVEAMWAVGNYRDLKASYVKQIESILDESVWQYTEGRMLSQGFSIGNIERFHTIVKDELRTAGIDTPFMVEVLSTTNADPILLMTMGGEGLGKERMTLEQRIVPIIMRLTVDDPHIGIMRSMRSMLILQVLSIVVLIATFLYMLRTLFRAKSIDNIRRDLTHNITHELKTPIAAAYAATDALVSIPALAENSQKRNEYLAMTLAELKRLDRMVEEVLRTSTEEAEMVELRLEECQLGTIIDEVVTTLDMKYSSRKVEWSIAVAEGLTVVADRFHLLSAISALVDNAIKYGGEQPRVSIEATTTEREVSIAIGDNGRGIAPSEQKRIFEKFYRISEGNRHDTHGYGLGLYYVRNIAKRHGGTIEVRSTRGEGSRFTLKLSRYGNKTGTYSRG